MQRRPGDGERSADPFGCGAVKTVHCSGFVCSFWDLFWDFVWDSGKLDWIAPHRPEAKSLSVADESFHSFAPPCKSPSSGSKAACTGPHACAASRTQVAKFNNQPERFQPHGCAFSGVKGRRRGVTSIFWVRHEPVAHNATDGP